MFKKVAIVTGCAGFIGLTFTRKLLEKGWKVYGIDKFTYVADQDELINLTLQFPENFEFNEQDIVDLDWIPECDVIFNLAAESDVDVGNLNSFNFVRSNVEGVRNLLQLINNRIVIRADKPLFFQLSTDEVYGDLTNGSFDEDSQLKPSNPYSATKASADLLIQSWARTYDLEYIIARPSNNYGPFQYPEKLIPLAVKRLQRGKKIKLHNKGTPIRQWTHTEDTADALITIYEKGDRNKVFNITSGFEQQNLETVKKILNCYFLDTIKRDIPDLESHLDLSFERPGQDVRYSITAEPLKKLGWVPKKEFDIELPKLVKHFSNKGWRW